MKRERSLTSFASPLFIVACWAAFTVTTFSLHALPDSSPNIAGKYQSQNLALELVLAADGAYSGDLRMTQGQFPLRGHFEAGELKGTGKNNGDVFSFQARLEGDQLLLAMGGATYTLKKQATPSRATAAASAAPDSNSTFTKSSNMTANITSTRSVQINGKAISDHDIQVFEQTYRLKIKDGTYWYDAKTGAWGMMGGPCAGIMMAGLNVGAPMPENASHGNTGTFINGRQLHWLDVVRLRMVLPAVWPGRYWMDAHGNFGFEGGPMLSNIWVAAAQTAQARNSGGGGGGGSFKREGILSTYDKTGCVVIGN